MSFLIDESQVRADRATRKALLAYADEMDNAVESAKRALHALPRVQVPEKTIPHGARTLAWLRARLPIFEVCERQASAARCDSEATAKRIGWKR